MLNPVLSVKAVDQVRANVTRQGENSRLVNFDITLSVSGTLEQMNVAFDLSTNDDITVQNELRSMSAEQRANQAMNLMLYNVYSGPGTSASANLSGNPLLLPHLPTQHLGCKHHQRRRRELRTRPVRQHPQRHHHPDHEL